MTYPLKTTDPMTYRAQLRDSLKPQLPSMVDSLIPITIIATGSNLPDFIDIIPANYCFYGSSALTLWTLKDLLYFLAETCNKDATKQTRLIGNVTYRACSFIKAHPTDLGDGTFSLRFQ
jgi:hypothetical protein